MPADKADELLDERGFRGSGEEAERHDPASSPNPDRLPRDQAGRVRLKRAGGRGHRRVELFKQLCGMAKEGPLSVYEAEVGGQSAG